MRQYKRIRRCCLLLGVFLSSLSFSGQALAMGNALENTAYVETEDWEEEYTDTDTRRGILAVRAETFQGFHGVVQAVFQNTSGGRRWMADLDGEPEYAVNLELPPGIYRLAELRAVSDGREFDCEAGTEEILVEDGKVSMFSLDVLPGSLYRLPYEETEGEESAAEGVKRKDGLREAGQGKAEEDEMKYNREELEMKSETAPYQVKRLPMVTFIGILGMMASVICLFYVLKRKREGG